MVVWRSGEQNSQCRKRDDEVDREQQQDIRDPISQSSGRVPAVQNP